MKWSSSELKWMKQHSVDNSYKKFIKEKSPKKRKWTPKLKKSKAHKKKKESKEKREHLTYREQLKDIRWFNKRQELFKKYGQSCCKCGATENLHIHHLYYIKGKYAWEYEDDCYQILCESCHQRAHCIDLDMAFLRALEC